MVIGQQAAFDAHGPPGGVGEPRISDWGCVGDLSPCPSGSRTLNAWLSRIESPVFLASASVTPLGEMPNLDCSHGALS